MHKITIDGKEVQISDESYEALSKAIQPERKGRWRAEKGDYYYRLYGDGKIDRETETNDIVDDLLFNLGNYYQTKEQAEQARDRQLAITRLRDYALENMPFEPDWRKIDQNKFSISYDFIDEEFDWSVQDRFKQQTELPYFKSGGDCERFIEENEEDLRCVFNIK